MDSSSTGSSDESFDDLPPRSLVPQRRPRSASSSSSSSDAGPRPSCLPPHLATSPRGLPSVSPQSQRSASFHFSNLGNARPHPPRPRPRPPRRSVPRTGSRVPTVPKPPPVSAPPRSSSSSSPSSSSSDEAVPPLAQSSPLARIRPKNLLDFPPPSGDPSATGFPGEGISDVGLDLDGYGVGGSGGGAVSGLDAYGDGEFTFAGDTAMGEGIGGAEGLESGGELPPPSAGYDLDGRYDIIVPERVEDELGDYAALLFDGGGLHVARLDSIMWVMEGYKDGEGEVGKFYHVTETPGLQGSFDSDCDCKATLSTCVHLRVFRAHRNRFQDEVQLSSEDDPEALEIAPDYLGVRSWLSVRKGRKGAVKSNRTIVRWVGMDRWFCVSCMGGCASHAACLHRRSAMERIKFIWDEDFEEQMVGNRFDDELFNMDELQAVQQDPVLSRSQLTRNPTSFCAVPPPRFAQLPSDTIPTYTYTNPIDLPPILNLYPSSTLRPQKLSSAPRCACGAEAVAEQPTKLLDCRIYGSMGVQLRQIRVQKCGCRLKGRRFTVGPDLSEYELFNWNNEIIVTHELLNSYTSQLNASPTTLTAFWTTTKRAYRQVCSPHAFFGKSTWNAIFFAFIELQSSDASFKCELCGPNPDIVIADGVSISFNSRHRKSSLRPPTVPSLNHLNELQKPPSLVQRRIGTAFLPNKKLRVEILAAIKTIRESPSSYDWTPISAATASFIQPPATPPLEQLALLPLLQNLQSLTAVNTSLPPLYLEFLRQLAAHEMVLQLCRPMTTSIITRVLSLDPTVPKDRQPSGATSDLFQLRIQSPSIGDLVARYHKLSVALPSELVGLLQALVVRVRHVFKNGSTGLCQSPFPPVEEIIEHDDWRKSGSCYGLPKVRERPFYEKFHEGGGVGEEGTGWGYAPPIVGVSVRDQEKLLREERKKEAKLGCQKYYARYSERKQTGGILALWCPHLICLGFHIIPRAEGRNDVFSALFAHWPIAPTYVIYDFAGALAPYCLAREAEFFKNTLFLIDEFHQNDHSKCSRACFLDNYMGRNGLLKKLNSSSAECGNAGLARIRKTVSYCDQGHATLFTRHFLQIWNRERILAMNAAAA